VTQSRLDYNVLKVVSQKWPVTTVKLFIVDRPEGRRQEERGEKRKKRLVAG
jgi:hypothetical protein